VLFSDRDKAEPFTVVRTVQALRATTLSHGNLNGAATAVTLNTDLITNAQLENPLADIRDLQFHETVGAALTLRAPTTFSDGAFSDNRLQYYGTYAAAQALAGRALMLVDSATASTQRVQVTTTLADLEAARYYGLVARDDDNPWLWDIDLDQPPTSDRAAFDQIEPTVTVYGNLVDATQGKTETEVVLGSGDNAQTFQTFAIPKMPLTYLLDATQTPAQVPELDVYVDGILWERAETFFNSAAEDQVYVVREDADGKSWVQFGDGQTGARLPSGISNVSAVYRSGSGATGALKTGATPQAIGKLTELEKVFLPGTVTGGDDPEDLENARRAAPGKMQSLDRLVGLADFEAETLALPGVIKVRADWDAPTGVPAIRIVVLTKTGTRAATDTVRDTLTTYNRCRGPARFPVRVEPGVRQFIYLRVRAGYDAAYRTADLQTEIAAALGVLTTTSSYDPTDTGLFALAARRFGQNAHRSHILAAVQQVAGVTWVEIDDAQALDLGDPPETDPANLDKPVTVSIDAVVPCLATHVLTLYTAHFDLSLTVDEVKKECG
jgi:predicted phage baseplate assembly protein